MGTIKAVLFDAGQTLYHADSPSTRNLWHRLMCDLGFDFSPETVEAAARAGHESTRSRWRQFETSGRPTSPDQLAALVEDLDRAVLQELGITENDDVLVKRINKWFTDGVHFELYGEVIPVLEELQRRGYRMAVVSDGSHQEEDLRKLGVDHFFDPIIGSIYVGYVKPMPEIYHLALDALEMRPDEAVMVGDNYERDVVGPEALGIRGVHLVRDDSDSPVERVITDLWELLDHLDD